MAWQFTSNRPIYLQIVDEIELRILSGAYEKGMRLPSVRELAMLAAVNPNTMQRALAELETKGLVDTQRTTGRTVTTDESVISAARDAMAADTANTYFSQMTALGLSREEALARLSKAIDKEGNHGNNS